MPQVTLESLQQELRSYDRKLELILKAIVPDSDLITPATAAMLLKISKTTFNDLVKSHPEWICKTAKGHKKIFRKMIEAYIR